MTASNPQFPSGDTNDLAALLLAMLHTIADGELAIESRKACGGRIGGVSAAVNDRIADRQAVCPLGQPSS